MGAESSRFAVVGADRLDDAIAERLVSLRSTGPGWSWADLIERGRIAIAEGDFTGAATVFESSLRSADRDVERAVSLQFLGHALLASAQSIPCRRDGERSRRDAALHRAGRVLNEAQQHVPSCRDLAAARVTAWSQAGDELETLAAEHQLRVIDPSMEGTARMEPATVAIICFVFFKSGQMVLKRCEFKGVLPAKHRATLLACCDVGVVTTLLLAPGGASLAEMGLGIAEGVAEKLLA